MGLSQQHLQRDGGSLLLVLVVDGLGLCELVSSLSRRARIAVSMSVAWGFLSILEIRLDNFCMAD